MPKAKWKNFTDEQIREIIKSCTSFQQVKEKMGYSSKSGSTTDMLKQLFDEKGFDYSHFKGHAWNKKEEAKEKRPYNKTGLSPAKIKADYISTHEYKCACCGISEWQGKPITLQLHHINGDRSHNEDDNLMLLCPNCHSQTDNFCGKNNKSVITDEEFLQALEEYGNVCAACRALHITPNQSSYARAKRLLDSAKEAK